MHEPSTQYLLQQALLVVVHCEGLQVQPDLFQQSVRIEQAAVEKP